MEELIWITGGSQGIGEALALAYARQGATVIISARHLDKLQQVVQKARTLKGRVVALPCDMTQPQQVQHAIQQILEQEGLPNRVILNAGTHQAMAAREFKAETVQQLLQINVMGVAYALEHLLPLYSQSTVVNATSPQIAIVASVAGYRGLPTASAYGASKAALINLAESLRVELYGQGVDIRLINPGFVKTPLTDKNRFAMPFLISAETAAQQIIKGLNSSRFEIVFPWQMSLLMKVLKWLPDRFFFPWVHQRTKV